MHPTILARNTSIAMGRMYDAANKLAGSYDLEAEAAALEGARHRDPGIENLRKAEATADLLEAVVKRLKAAELEADRRVAETAERIGQIDGIGPKTMETIRAELGLPEPEPEPEPQKEPAKAKTSRKKGD